MNLLPRPVALRPWTLALLVFGASLAVSDAVIWTLESARLQAARALAASQAGERAQAIQRIMERAFSAAFALGAMVRQGQGSLPTFSETARQMLPFYPGVGSLQLAPGGVVSQIVPLVGNEKAIGHNLLADPQRTKEAFLARDNGQLTLAGPFALVQGGSGAAARLPVFLGADHERSGFWGFVVVLVRFPQVLQATQLDVLTERGFHYALWRIHPDTQHKQVIASSGASDLQDPVSQVLQVANATWTLSISPIPGWGDTPGLLRKASLGLMLSLLLAGLAKLFAQSRNQEKLLEQRVAQRTRDWQRFAEITAHHLQEPARRMATYAQRLQSQLAGQVQQPEAMVSLDFIGQQARRLRQLLIDVERYLAADQPRGPLALIEPQSVLQPLLARWQPRIDALGARVVLGELPAVWIDAPRLKDLFEAALDNALQFGQPVDAGVVRQIHITGQCAGSRGVMRVTDNGPGIDAQYHARVFRVFERLSSASPGSGVGLAMIAHIAESCGGRAWLESASPGGCQLCIELPTQDPA